MVETTQICHRPKKVASDGIHDCNRVCRSDILIFELVYWIYLNPDNVQIDVLRLDVKTSCFPSAVIMLFNFIAF